MQLVQERGFKAPQLCLIYTDLCISIATKNIFKYCTIFHNQNNTSTLMWGGGVGGLEESLNLVANLFCEESLEESNNPFSILLFSKITINNKTYTKLEEEIIDMLCLYDIATLHWNRGHNPRNYSIDFIAYQYH